MKKADKSPCVRCGYQGQQAPSSTGCDTDVAKVNTQTRPEGQKKAYARLAPD